MNAPAAGGAADAGTDARKGRGRRARGCLGAGARLVLWTLAALALLAAAAAWFLSSDSAEERGRRLLEAKLSEVLGRPVSAGGVEFGAWPLSVTVHDLVIPGPQPADPPFARVPEAEVQLDLGGLRRPRVHVRQVYVRAPEVRLVLGDDGATNLPEIRSRGGGGRVEVTIGALIVRDGVFRLDERTLPLDLEARELWLRADGSGDPEGRRFTGGAAAERVTLTLPDAEPYRGAVVARAAVESGRVEIAEVRFAGPEITARADGEVRWDDASRRVELAVEADAEAALFNRLGYSEEPLAGPLRLTAGRFDYAATVGDDSAGEWSFTGDLASPRLEALGYRFTDAAAALTADAGGVRVAIGRAGFAGGGVRGTVTVPANAGAEEGAPTRVETDLAFDRLALAEVLAELELELGEFTGSVSGRAGYDFTTEDPAGGDGRVSLDLAAVERRPGALPLAGRAEIAIRGGVLTTDGAEVTARGQRLTATGGYDLASGRGSFSYRLESADLATLYGALPLPAEPAPAEAPAGAPTDVIAEPVPAPWRVTAGTGIAEGVLTLAPESFEATAAVDLTGVRTPALAFDRIRGTLRADAEAIRELDLEADRDGGGLRVAGTVPLAATEAAPALDLGFDLTAWPIAELAPLLVPEGTPDLAGRVSGRFDLAGAPAGPGEELALSGRTELEAAPFEVAGIAVERATASGSFDPERLRLESLELALGAGTVRASGTLDPATGALSARLEAPALDLGTAPFAGWVPGDLGGSLELTAAASGTLERPEVNLALAGSGLTLAGRELGEDGLAEATARWSGGRLEAEGSLLGLVDLDGGGRLELPAAGAPGAVEVDLEFTLAGDDLRGLAQLAAEQPLPDLEGAFHGTLAITGRGTDAAAAEGVVARLALDRLTLETAGQRVDNLEPVTATLDGSELTVESLYLGQAAGPSGGEAGGGNELFVTGRADLGAEGVPLDLRFQGMVQADWLEPALPGSDLSGTLAVLGTVRGTAAAPRVNGQGEIDGGRAILSGFPHALDRIGATVLFEPDGAVILDSLRAELAGGDVRAQGRLDLPAEEGGEPSYRFQAAASGFNLRWPEGFVLRGGSDLSLTAVDGGRQVTGVVELDRIFYLQDVTVSLTQLLQEAFQRQRLEAGEGDVELTSTQLAVAVRGPLRVRNNIADLRGDAELVIRGTLAAPAVFGQVTLDPGGTVSYADTTYSIERGLLTFANPLRIDPVIDLVASAEVDDYDVTLQLSGTLDRLDARFSSDPPLADLEVLQLLATGSAPTGGSGLPVAGGQEGQDGGAATLLYGQAASLVTERVNTLFGFDRFRVNPGIGGAVGFAVGKRLSRDFYVTVSNDPVNDLDYVVQAEWRVSDLVTLVLTQRGEEAFAVDLRWEKQF